MSKIKDIYQGMLEQDKTVTGKREWLWLVGLCLFVYGVSVAFRMSFADRWDHELLWVAGERILSTHDAYYWLARAKGVGESAHIPLAQAARFFHDLTGIGYGSIAFWGPALIAPLTGVVCACWGWLGTGRRGMLFAGLIGALTPGFFYRSRLGYFDTDLFTLFGPMLCALLLGVMVRRYCHSGWFSSPEDQGEALSFPMLLIQAMIFGLLTRLAGIWHLNIISLNIIVTLLACFYVAVNGKAEKRGEAFLALAVFIIAAFPGSGFMQYTTYPLFLLWSMIPLSQVWMGCVLAPVVVLCLVLTQKNKPVLVRNVWVGLVVLVAILLLTNITYPALSGIANKAMSYFPSATTGVESSLQAKGPVFPSILQSIIENKSVSMSEILGRGVFWPWLGWIALLASPVVILLRPSTLLLLPFVVLQLFSMQMGARFTMFGGAALIVFLGIALGLVVDALAKQSRWRNAVGLGVQAVCGLAMLLYCHNAYATLPLTPVVTKDHAEALIDLGQTAPEDAMIWTWWDWGYASQYYAGLKTMVDGGQHSGAEVFPVGLALSTESPEQSNRIIRYSSQFKPDHRFYLGYQPARQWKTMPAAEAMDQIEAMKTEPVDVTAPVPQYLVVTWKDLTIAKWITFYGNWNLESGQTKQAKATNFKPGELGFNLQRGAVMTRDGRGGLVTDAVELGKGKADSYHYFMNSVSPRLLPTTPHLYVNRVSKQAVLLDRTGARALMTRLLTGDPDDPEITPYFKLVVDNLPFARIYEVVQ